MSDKQRKMYFSVCQLIADELGLDSYKYVHEIFKDKFLPFDKLSTTQLGKKEVENYLNRVYSFVTQELGIILDESRDLRRIG